MSTPVIRLRTSARWIAWHSFLFALFLTFVPGDIRRGSLWLVTDILGASYCGWATVREIRALPAVELHIFPERKS